MKPKLSKQNYYDALTIINLLGIAAIIILALVLFQKNLKDFLLVCGFFLFTPILLIIALVAGALGLAIFQLVKIKKDLNNSSFSKRKRIKLFSIAIINFLIYPIICFLLFPASNHVQQNRRQAYVEDLKPQVERSLSEAYHKASFKNFKIKIDRIDDYQTEGSFDQTVHYRYTERIGKRIYSVKQEISVDRDTGKIDSNFSNNYISADITEDNFDYSGTKDLPDITANAIFFQPELIKKMKQEPKLFKPILKADQKLNGAYGDYNFKTITKKQVKELRQMVLANRKKNSPVAGYYDLDFNRLAKEKIISYNVFIKMPYTYSKKDYRYTLKRLPKVDASKLLPGEHNLIFEYHYHRKNESGYDDRTVSFWVDHGQISQIKLHNY